MVDVIARYLLVTVALNFALMIRAQITMLLNHYGNVHIYQVVCDLTTL